MKQRVFVFVVSVLGFCAPLSAQVADLYLDVPLNGSVGDGQSTFYRLSVPTSAHLVLTLKKPNRCSTISIASHGSSLGQPPFTWGSSGTGWRSTH
jgi:hypothetical protein